MRTRLLPSGSWETPDLVREGFLEKGAPGRERKARALRAGHLVVGRTARRRGVGEEVGGVAADQVV